MYKGEVYIRVYIRAKWQNNTSFRELPFGVLKLLHALLVTCYTKYTFLLSTLNC